MSIAAYFQNMVKTVSNTLGTDCTITRKATTGYDANAGTVTQAAPTSFTCKGSWMKESKRGFSRQVPDDASEVRTRTNWFVIGSIDATFEPDIEDEATLAGKTYKIKEVDPVFVKQIAVSYRLRLELA